MNAIKVNRSQPARNKLDSASARDLEENPRAALVFYWPELERQVRIEGSTTRTSASESDKYFQSRPRGHQLSAWVSTQSDVIANRGVLEERLDQFEKRYPDTVPLPPFWGGYILSPTEIEFWQGRPNRLHDRFRYTKQANGNWLIERLAP